MIVKAAALLFLLGVIVADLCAFWPNWHALAFLAAIGIASFMAGRSAKRAFPWEKS